MTDVLTAERKSERVWFYPPEMYWHGISTLSPVAIGHDDYARNTLMLGWTITGRIIIALGDCGNDECRDDAIEYANDYAKMFPND